MDASNNRDNSNSRKAMAMAENITNNGVSLPLNGFRIFLFKLWWWRCYTLGAGRGREGDQGVVMDLVIFSFSFVTALRNGECIGLRHCVHLNETVKIIIKYYILYILGTVPYVPVFRIRIQIRIHRIHMFIGLPDQDQDQIGKGMDPDPFIIKQNM